jgi:hypothetical protein
MTAHTCTEITPGCHQCNLHKDELTGLTNTTEREWQAWVAGTDHGYDAGYEHAYDQGYLTGAREWSEAAARMAAAPTYEVTEDD